VLTLLLLVLLVLLLLLWLLLRALQLKGASLVQMLHLWLIPVQTLMQ
jgi:hypothetical protein